MIARGVWTFIVEPFSSRLPKSLSRLRIFVLRVFGARIGRGCTVFPGSSVLMPWNLELDDLVVIGPSVIIYNFATIKIRRQTVISQRCFLCTGSHDYTEPSMPLTWKPIDIGAECWMAAEAFIAPGVTVADGVVVGARSVVTRSIDAPWTVWAGNPAKLIKARQMKDNHEA